MPGPPRTPIVGNIIPTLTPWVTLAKFGEKYGEHIARFALG